MGPDSMSLADLAKSATKERAGPKLDLLPGDKVHQEYGSDIHCWIRLRAMSGANGHLPCQDSQGQHIFDDATYLAKFQGQSWASSSAQRQCREASVSALEAM